MTLPTNILQYVWNVRFFIRLLQLSRSRKKYYPLGLPFSGNLGKTLFLQERRAHVFDFPVPTNHPYIYLTCGKDKKRTAARSSVTIAHVVSQVTAVMTSCSMLHPSVFRLFMPYIIVIPWVVCLYVEIIHELYRVDYLTYRWTGMI